MKHTTILWKRLDSPGHDACCLEGDSTGWHIHGVAAFRSKRRVAQLCYEVHCNTEWRTQSATVTGRIGGRVINARIQRSARGLWKLNGEHVPDLNGCDDVDLALTPATNTIAIRRLALRRGDSQHVRSAWFNVEDDECGVLEQSYTRLSRDTYQYEAPRFNFHAKLTVNTHGLVTHYPTLWKVEA